MKLRGRVVNGGNVQGIAVVLDIPFSFIGDFDPSTGTLVLAGHPLNGESIAGKILVCPGGKGGTIAPFVAYQASTSGNAPKAIICEKADPILCESAIVINIPLLDRFEKSPISAIRSGQSVRIEGEILTVDE